MADDLELYDLRARPAPQRDAECLQFHENVYGPSFPDPAIREEVELLTDRRSNRLLLVIAVSGLLSVFKNTLDLVDLGPMAPRSSVPLVATVVALVGVVVVREAWVLVQNRMRCRRALRDGVSDRLEPLDRDLGER